MDIDQLFQENIKLFVLTVRPSVRALRFFFGRDMTALSIFLLHFCPSFWQRTGKCRTATNICQGQLLNGNDYISLLHSYKEGAIPTKSKVLSAFVRSCSSCRKYFIIFAVINHFIKPLPLVFCLSGIIKCTFSKILTLRKIGSSPPRN